MVLMKLCSLNFIYSKKLLLISQKHEKSETIQIANIYVEKKWNTQLIM
jgi:hypothetical protein